MYHDDPWGDPFMDGGDSNFDPEDDWELAEKMGILPDGTRFADPGGRSALRASGPGNPRNLPCPTCKEPNRLTPADQARGYQCDRCAGALEGCW